MHSVAFIPLARRNGHGLVNRPAVLDSLSKHGWLEAEFMRPLSNGLRATIPLHEDVRSLVVEVVSMSNPATVPWLVVPVHVDTVDFVCRSWRQLHVSDECSERFTPSVADLDATRSVVLEVTSGRTRATGNHVLPATSDARSGQTMALGLSATCGSIAPAGPIVSGVQMSCAGNVFASTVASTSPSTLAFPYTNELLDDEIAEPTTDEVMLMATHDARSMRVGGRASRGVTTRVEARFILAKAA